MDSAVGICNEALTILGARRILSLEDESTEARNCAAVFWNCVELTLQAHNWSFAAAQIELAPLVEVYAGWAYAYRYPQDCLRIISMIDPVINEDWHYPIASSDYTVQLAVNGDCRVLLTSHERVIMKYVKYVKNISVFSSAFRKALVWQIAITLGRQLKGAASNEVAAYIDAYVSNWPRRSLLTRMSR